MPVLCGLRQSSQSVETCEVPSTSSEQARRPGEPVVDVPALLDVQGAIDAMHARAESQNVDIHTWECLRTLKDKKEDGGPASSENDQLSQNCSDARG